MKRLFDRSSIYSNSVIIIIILTIFCINFSLKLWKKDKVIEWDVIWYYSYLPATFIYDDLTLNYKFDIDVDAAKIQGKLLDNGNYIIKTTAGTAILYAPFFFVAHLLADPLGYSPDGYSDPYEIALILSAIFYLAIGFIFLKKTMKYFFDDTVIGITLFAIGIGSNIIWFSTVKAPMPHVYQFMLFSLFVYYTIKWNEKINTKNSIIIGLLAGFITLIRPTDVLIVLVFIFYDVSSFKRLKEKVMLFISSPFQLSVIIVFAFIAIFPQLAYWKFVTGDWIFYSYTNDEQLFLSNPQILRGLFGFRKGWLLYTPVMAFSLIGIPYLWKYMKQFAFPFSLFTIVNIYVIFSWWCWWYGGSFSSRSMIDSYPILALPMALIISRIFKTRKLIKFSLILVLFLSIFMGAFHTIQFYNQAIHYDGMTKKAYINSFGKINPSREYWSLLRRPNYKAAHKGLYIDEIKNTFELRKSDHIVDSIFCDLEVPNFDTTSFISVDKKVIFKGGKLISHEKSFSGANSIKLDKENKFGLSVVLSKLKAGEKYLITVKTNSKSDAGRLVVSSKTPKFYKAEMPSKGDTSDWKEIDLLFKVPRRMNNKDLRVYVWNRGNEEVYFDDLIIRKLK